MNLSLWLGKELADVLRRHVPKREDRSAYGKAALEAALRRDGAFDATNADAAKVLKSIPAAALPLVVELSEIVAAKGDQSGDVLERLRAILAELKTGALEEAAVGA